MAMVYTVNVNGRSYDVSVEKKIGTIAANATGPAMVIAQDTNVSATPTVTKAKPAEGAAGNQIVAPMPGRVIAVKVNIGDSVKQNQEVVIVEAMKMNNPILAPREGVIKEVYVRSGDPIQTGTPLVMFG